MKVYDMHMPQPNKMPEDFVFAGLQPFQDWQLGLHGSTPLRQDPCQEATAGEAEMPVQSLS